MAEVIGWDIGGAHLKAARAKDGCITAALTVASPLRLGLGALVAAFAEAKARIGSADAHAVTMTGELADTFASRAAGVVALSNLAAAELAGSALLLYAGRAGFIEPQQAAAHVADIASANWHASAMLLARRSSAALFVDVGSTTTDLVPVAAGRLLARGYCDASRLAAGELVYTGLVRSPLMAIATRAPFAGRWTALINENFAHMADVHRLLGTLPEGADLMSTADGGPKTAAASAVRLARMVAAEQPAADDLLALARWFAELQIRAISDGAMLVLSASRLPQSAPLVGAGIGTALIGEIARRLERPYVGFESLVEVLPQARLAATHCAPAAALALLAGQRIAGR